MFEHRVPRLICTLLFAVVCWLGWRFPANPGGHLSASPGTTDVAHTPIPQGTNTAPQRILAHLTPQDGKGKSDKPGAKSRPATLRVTRQEARRRAELFHETIESTLMLMHREYFEEGGNGKRANMIPSKALESVFNRVARRSHIEARWLAVNAQAMSIDHRPQDAFERQAVRALTKGEQEFTAVEDGNFRRATQIALFGSCVKCHAPPPMNPSVRRVAGLLVKIPIQTETPKSDSNVP